MKPLTWNASVVAAAVVCLLGSSASRAAYSPWSHYDRTSGLAGNRVQAIIQDGAGGLWVGTGSGLSHYDGANWKTFNTARGLPDNDVHSLFIDDRKRLWVGAGAGFGLYNEGRWGRLGVPGEGSGGRVAVVTDGEGRTWFGFPGGLMSFDPLEGRLEKVPEMEGKEVTALLADRDGNLWVGTSGGLHRWNGHLWKEVAVARGLPSGPVTALLEDTRGHVWCGRTDGLLEHDGASWESYGVREGIPSAAVTSLAEDRKGRVWVGTGTGAGYYDGYDWFWLDSATGLPGDSVLALCADGNGSIWVGTTRGLAKFETSWTTLERLGRDDLTPASPLLASRGGSLFLGAESGFLEMEGEEAYLVGPDDGIAGRVNVMLENEDGDLWLGTEAGLYLYDGRIREEFHPPPSKKVFKRYDDGSYEYLQVREYDHFTGLKGEKVTALTLNGEGGIWVGTSEGLSRYDGRTWEFVEGNDAVAGGDIRALASDGDGALWVGTSDGLWLRGDDGWSRFDRSSGLAGNEVASLAVDRAGDLWVGTDRGLCRRRGDTWESFGEGNGLLGNRVLTIFQDSAARLWFGTADGVGVFDGQAWGAFSEIDGLHANRVTSITQTGGEIWMGSDRGVSVYRPDRVKPDTRIKNPPEEVVGTPFVMFEAAGCDLETPPHRLRYSWSLDGGPWSSFSADSLVTVNDLANGMHTFSVRSMDLMLNIDQTPVTVMFEVNTGLFDLEIVDVSFATLYASLYQFYAGGGLDRDPAGVVDIRSKFDRPLRVKVSTYLPQIMDFPTDTVITVPAGETVSVPLAVEFNESVLDLAKTGSRQLLLSLRYNLQGELKESESTYPVTIVEKHGMTWEDPRRIALYVTHLDPVVERFAREVLGHFADAEKTAIVYDNLLRGIEIFDALGAHGVRYVPDPDNPYDGLDSSRTILDLVHFPRETLQGGTGDCDDLAVLYAALLQNIGIDTALVDVLDHVFVMFDTGLRERQARQLVRNRDLLHVDEEGRIWVPVEVTLVGQSFTAAWKSALETMASRRFEVIDIGKAWKRYVPVTLTGEPPVIATPARDAVWPLFSRDLELQEEALTSPEIQELRRRVAENPRDSGAANSLGVLLARSGFLGQAARQFRRVIELSPRFAGGYSNLANVLYEQENYKEAVNYYQASLERAELPDVLVELALTHCEMREFDLARREFRRAVEIDPRLGEDEISPGTGEEGEP